MATVNYSWNLPTVGGDEDAWGGLLNANWTALDTLLGGTNATEFAILDGATVTTAELNLLDGAVDHATAAWETGTATDPGVPSPADVKAAIDALVTPFDASSVASDIVPDADSTRDLGSSTVAWALAYLDAIEPVGTDTTIKRVGGTATTPIVRGTAAAWVNFNGTGTIAARDSLNVSSLTDSGTGIYTINFTNAFVSADYTIAGLVQRPGSNTGSNVGVLEISGAVSPTASAATVWSRVVSATIEDMPIVAPSMLGDLA